MNMGENSQAPSSVPSTERIADFRNPPVREVVVGVQFDLNNLKTSHIALFGNTLRAEFPHLEEVPPLPKTFLGNSLALPSTSPLRLLLHNEARTQLVQLQTERFHVNWRATDAAEGQYPEYGQVKENFFKQWNQFNVFCEESQLGRPIATMYEYTYFNDIANKQALSWLNIQSLGEEAEDFNVQLRFPAAECNGELHVRAGTALKLSNNSPITLLEFTVRGLPGPSPATSGEFETWCDCARSRIVKTFVSSTAEAVRTKTWGQI
jgi:uncharacterized protein (TIGR04255 family)